MWHLLCFMHCALLSGNLFALTHGDQPPLEYYYKGRFSDGPVWVDGLDADSDNDRQLGAGRTNINAASANGSGSSTTGSGSGTLSAAGYTPGTWRVINYAVRLIARRGTPG
jgi:hypothetical protein